MKFACPQVVIILIGTNDRSAPERVLAGIVANVQLVRQKQPAAAILVLVRIAVRDNELIICD